MDVEQSVWDKMKADLSKVTGERDANRGEVDKVKRDGEKLIDDAATLQRTVDDQKKEIRDLAKGIASGAGSGSRSSSNGDTDKPDRKPFTFTGFFNTLWYYPQKPPQSE